MPLSAFKSLAWAPTIALSWLWGLGFFYSIHVTITYGWLGFVSFAVPNAIGLFLFGFVLGARRRDPEAIFAALQGPFAGLFLLCQIFAVALTVFGVAAYLLVPLKIDATVLTILLLLLACAVGQAASLQGLKRLHGVYLVVGVAAALLAWWQLDAVAHTPVALASFDARFYGLALPTLMGFLLGPWLDVQHWHRVIEIRREGASSAVAYAGGALLFAMLLTVNALLAAAAGTGFVQATADGIAGAQASVTLALSAGHLPTATIAFAVWVTIAAVSTIDSFFLSTRWMMTAVLRRSVSPLLTFIPAGFVGSPLWLVAIAAIVSGAMIEAHLSMIYLMVPFATMFVSGGVCLVAETLGATRQYDAMLCALIGLASALIFVVGYIAPMPAFMTLAPLIGLVGATPMLLQLAGFRVAPTPGAERAVSVVPEAGTAQRASLVRDPGASHGFDGFTFVMHMIPTYDDTNSVGNVYFANYMRWVGKARELFFNHCMPDFDLKTTDFYILTHSFRHDFRREAKEFEAITVRIKILKYNRKFVTLDHEIYSDLQGLLGRGEQSLMFVDRASYRPLDIPRQVIDAFLPYWPLKGPMQVGERQAMTSGGPA